MNAIYNACLNGVSLNNSSLYIYGLPICSSCALGIIQVGIKNIFMLIPRGPLDQWKESWELSKELFNEVNINYEILEE